jgi:hypothetical protein
LPAYADKIKRGRNAAKGVFMKRIVCILLLAAAGSLIAEEASAQTKIAVGLDTMPLLKGIIWSDADADDGLFALSPSVEILMASRFSVGGTVDLWFGTASDISVFYFALAGQGRWYPLSTNLDKLFIGVNLGFSLLSVDGEAPKAEDGGFFGLTTGLKVGWKIKFGPRFFVEPSMAYVYAKTGFGSGVPTPLGWQPGLIAGVSF